VGRSPNSVGQYLACVNSRRNAAEWRQTWGRDTWLYNLGCRGKFSTLSLLFSHSHSAATKWYYCWWSSDPWSTCVYKRVRFYFCVTSEYVILYLDDSLPSKATFYNKFKRDVLLMGLTRMSLPPKDHPSISSQWREHKALIAIILCLITTGLALKPLCRCHAKYVALPNNSQYEICVTCGNY